MQMGQKWEVNAARVTPRWLNNTTLMEEGQHQKESKVKTACCQGDTTMSYRPHLHSGKTTDRRTQKYKLHAARATPRWLINTTFMQQGQHQDDAKIHAACGQSATTSAYQLNIHATRTTPRWTHKNKRFETGCYHDYISYKSTFNQI